jgi:iron complex outermembrane receptor protein
VVSKGKKSKVALLAGAMAIVSYGNAYADDASPPTSTTSVASSTTSTDITVTARRRNEALQDVPLTVSAVSGDALRNLGYNTIHDVVEMVPNAVIQDSPNNLNTFINIRGMQEVNTQSEPNVGLYRNGLYAGGERENLGAQVDIDRIEVLRGPQGGYYGRSSVGGTVDIIDAAPRQDFDGYVKASYGSYNQTNIEGAINIPITDTLAVRVAAWRFKQTGSELKNATLNENVDAFADRGVRTTILFKPIPQFDIQVMGEYEAYHGPALTSFAPNGISGNGLTFQPAPPETYNTVYWDTPSVSTRANAYFQLKSAFHTDIGDLNVNGSYRDYHFHSSYDLDQTALGAPYNIQGVTAEDDRVFDTFLETYFASKPEDRFTWMVGASYFRERFDYDNNVGLTANIDALTGLPLGLGVQTVPIGDPANGTAIVTNSYSVFGNFGYRIDSHWSINAGVRYNSDSKDLTLLSGIQPIANPTLAYIAGAAFGSAFPTYNLTLSRRFQFTAPSVTIKYAPTSNVNIYATYGSGFRPGSFNLTPTSTATVPYDEEKAQNIEAGVKLSLFSGKLVLDSAIFHMWQSNVLITESTPLSQSYYANAGTSRTTGFELEARFKPTSWLGGGASLGLLDPKFHLATVDAGTASAYSLNNDVLPYTRRGTFNAMLNVDKPLTGSVDFIANGAARLEWGGVLGDYVGVLAPYQAFHKIDLQAGVLVNGRTRLTVGVKNLLNEHISQFLFYNGAETVTPGRTFSVDLTHKF